MAYYDTTWYCNFGNGTSDRLLRRDRAPAKHRGCGWRIAPPIHRAAVGSERVFVCIIAGTTANVTDATWVLTRGAKTTDGTATWQECTGMLRRQRRHHKHCKLDGGQGGGHANARRHHQGTVPPAIRSAHTAGTMAASEPSFSDTAGATTTDGTSVWTCIGLVGNFTGGAAPHARLANVGGNELAGRKYTIYIGNNHAETQSTGMTITTSGATPTGGRIICHNLGSYPPGTANMTTGATVSTTGTGFTIFSPVGSFYVYGVSFRGGVGGSFCSCIWRSPYRARALRRIIYFSGQLQPVQRADRGQQHHRHRWNDGY